jgi:hypothetical protein
VAAGRCAPIDAGVLAIEMSSSTTDAGGTRRDGATDAATARDAARDGSGVADASGGSADAASGDAGSPTEPGPLGGLRGEYFGRPDFTDLRAVRLDRAIRVDDMTEVPTATFPRENYSVRWTGEIRVPRAGRYELRAQADDGVRVWLDGERVIDAFEGPTPVSGVVTRMLDAGRAYDLRVEYQQLAGAATLRLEWSFDGGDPVAIPTTALTARRGEAWGCAGGECCPVGPQPLCCPTGTRCVLDPTFRGCCPEGETCIAVPACAAHPG